MRIVFMGTPEFAVPSLKAIAISHHELVGVVTTTDKPAGRGLKIRPSSVKIAAQKLNMPIYQPTDLNRMDFTQDLKNLKADLFVVVAFRILPPAIFNLPPKGTINLHASLLPKYRGAAPINWAIINGENETGLTTIFIQEKVDTGDIILQKKIPINQDETAGGLHDRLAIAGAALLIESINLIEKGNPPKSHQKGEVTKAPKLTKELSKIRWTQSNIEIHNLVRGLCPYPGAHTILKNKSLKIFTTKCTNNSNISGKSGEIIKVEPKAGKVLVATGSGGIELLELQPEGKRRMKMSEYLKGHTLKIGDRFE